MGPAECASACTCPGGFDCFVYDETADPALVGTPYAGCMYQASEYQMQQQGVTWPTNSPTDPQGNPTGYTTMEECCNATECCRAVCETDPAQVQYMNYTALTSSGPALQGGGGGTIPCYWIPQSESG